MFLKIILLALLFAFLSNHFDGVNSTPLSTTIATTTTTTEKDETISNFVKFTKANIISDIDRCDDFYTYACGNWKNNEMIPKEIQTWSATKLAEFELNKLIEEFVKNPNTTEMHSSESKVKQFYTSCIEMSKNLEESVKPIINYLDGKIPQNNLNSTKINWIFVNFLFDEFTQSPFIKLEILDNGENEENSTKKISIKYQQQEWFTRIITLMQSVLTTETEHGAKFFKHIPKGQQFHNQLKLLSENNNISEILTIDEFLTKYHETDGINWEQVFNLYFNGKYEKTWKIHNYLKNINQYKNLLKNTDKEIIFYYTAMKLISEYMSMFQDQVYIPVEKSCIYMTKTHFQTALMPWLIEKTNAIKWHEDIEKIIQLIKDALVNRVLTNYWLDDATKLVVKNKLLAMKHIIGYTDEMINRENMDNEYSNVKITDNFFENLLELKKKEIRDLKKKTKYPKDALKHAKYYPERNIFSIPLQYTQKPFYDKNWSDLIKLGGIGFIIGYEMASGFNTDNYKLNAKGKEENLWTEGSIQNFTKRNECMKSQLNELKYNNITIGDRITLAEIVANDLGARIAQDAYYKMMEEQSNSDKKIHNDLDLTNKQLFYVQLSHMHCNGGLAVDLLKYWPTEFYAVEPFRVNGILLNKPEFAEAFNCSKTSKLNPEKKCK